MVHSIVKYLHFILIFLYGFLILTQAIFQTKNQWWVSTLFVFNPNICPRSSRFRFYHFLNNSLVTLNIIFIPYNIVHMIHGFEKKTHIEPFFVINIVIADICIVFIWNFGYTIFRILHFSL